MQIAFSPQQSDFIKTELGINIKPNESIDIETQILRKIRDYCIDVEIAEVQNADETKKPLSDRGKTAISIQDLIYDTQTA